jgi:hypothetical protein
LRSSNFWHHRIRPGRENTYAAITRAGGGLEKLRENIEYAYFDDDTFSILLEPTSRRDIRESIVKLIERDSLTESGGDRLGFAFHESFALNMPALAQVLAFLPKDVGLGEGSATMLRDLLSQKATLGPNYVKAMPRYCVGAGLLDHKYRLTAFGDVVTRSDPGLTSTNTLWSMHYHLSSSLGPGPEFWHKAVTTLFRPGDLLQTNDVADVLQKYAQASSRMVSPKTSKSTASALLGSYSKSDALGPLGILTQEESGRYRVLEPTPPSLWAFAYGLADYWATNWREVTGVNLARVAEEGGIGPVFMMGGGLINRYLGDLQREGFAVVQRRTAPFQLTRNWTSPEVFLERMYG